jgi:Zn-dependent protease
MGRSWRFGQAFGIGLFLHWSFFLLPIWVFALGVAERSVESAWYMVAIVLTVFACVVLHELGHALCARLFGIQTRDITLFPIGGVARLERMPERPLEEFWIAIAGPAVNVVIAMMLIPISTFMGATMPEVFAMRYLGLGVFLLTVGIMNASLVVFNMIPAFPMDGGRVLRALLATFLSRVRATEIAAAVGLALAAVMFFKGILQTGEHPNGIMLSVLSLFVMVVGQRELAYTRQREQHRYAPVLEVLPADPDVVDIAALPARPNFSGFTWDDRLGHWVEWRDGRPVHRIQIQPD